MIERRGDRYLIGGRVTLDTVAALRAQGLREFEGARPVVDFSGVEAADSSALSLMLEWLREFRAQGRDIAFARLGASLGSLAALYGIADLIPIAAE
jgi:phospholipid transport system transporter-binding protein